MNKNIIWISDITDEDLEAAKENYLINNEDATEEDVTDSDIYDWAEQTKMDDLVFEEENLMDVKMPGEIFLVGVLERWNGSHSAYKSLKTNSVGNALREAVMSFGGDNSFEIAIEDGKVLIRQWGHDNPTNPSIFEFRSVKGCDSLDSLIYVEDKDDTEFLMKNSESPAKEICEVYGWEVAA